MRMLKVVYRTDKAIGYINPLSIEAVNESNGKVSIWGPGPVGEAPEYKVEGTLEEVVAAIDRALGDISF